jgi:tight adherence protein B
VAGPAVVVAAVRARRRRYARELRKGAAGTARALADAVGAGHSIRGAVTVAADGIAGPAGHELQAAARGLALGDPTAAVLERLRRRAADPAWDAIVAGILLQRDAGGDLAGLLRDQASALEAAERIEREARTATAQARFTARLVLLLPAGAALLAELTSPGLIAGLLAHPLSVWLVAMAGLLQATAILAVARLARPR